MATAKQQSELAAVEYAGGDFASLLKKEFKPKTEEVRSEVERAVQTLAEQALGNTKLIGSDVVASIESIIAAIDRKLSEQVNAIIHHEDFQKMESAWRGLHYLVNKIKKEKR